MYNAAKCGIISYNTTYGKAVEIHRTPTEVISSLPTKIRIQYLSNLSKLHSPSFKLLSAEIL
jgi:hypothetical protein